MALTLLARILTLVLALIVVAVQIFLIAILGVLTLIVTITLMLDIVSGICLQGVVAFVPRIQMTLSLDVPSVD